MIHDGRVQILSPKPGPPATLPLRQAPNKASKRDDGFWREIKHDVQDYMLHFDHENVEDLSRFAKSVGGGLKGAWKQIRDIPAKLLSHPVIRDKVSDSDRNYWSTLGEDIGLVAGFVAAGGHALAGALKLGAAIKGRNIGKGLDALVDITSGTSLALAVAGLAGARMIIGPIAATLNIVRGSFNAINGFKRGDQRKQLQGVLDVTRSIGSFGRLLKKKSPVFKVIGIGLAPVAGALQAGRGVFDIATGLRNDDNRKELNGLVDIATAVGTALAFASGAAVIPGIALAVAANLVKVGYQLSPRFRKGVDKTIDKLEPKLVKVVARVDVLTEPIVSAWKSFMGGFIKKIDASAPDRISKAQLAEIASLLHSDGRFDREESSRLRTQLESGGQRKELPKREAQPLALRRADLLKELPTKDSRVGFLSFMLVVAGYDFKTGPEEMMFLRGLASDLGVESEVLTRLVEERAKRHVTLHSKAS